MRQDRGRRARIMCALEKMLQRMRKGDELVWWELVDGRDGVSTGTMALENALSWLILRETLDGWSVDVDRPTWRMLKARAEREGVTESVMAERIIIKAAAEAAISGDGLGPLAGARFRRVRGAVIAVPLSDRAGSWLSRACEKLSYSRSHGPDAAFRVLLGLHR